MDGQDPHLPIEMLEHIISFIPHSDAYELWHSQHRRALLTCALVCKTWMELARRRLLSLYFPTGKFRIRAEPEDVLTLVGVFQSPLRTIDPAFIKVLDFTTEMPTKPSYGIDLQSEPSAPKSFFSALSTLGAALFPSLQTIEFEDSLLPSDKGGNGDTLDPPSLSVLSQIRSLVIYTPKPTSFKDIVGIIQLCPLVEGVTAFLADDGRYKTIDPSLYPLPHPPKSLRKLTLDMQTLMEMTMWVIACRPHYMSISSLAVHSFIWNDHIKSSYLRVFLDIIGSNLEELVLGVADYTPGAHFTVHDPDAPLKQFTKNTSLKRVTLKTTLNVAVEVIPYLFKQTHFALDLEVLEIAISNWEPNGTNLAKLRSVDQNVHSRPLLCRIILSFPWSRWPEYWEEVESRIREFLPRCEEKGMVGLKLRSQE